jgi:CelD/BcsL family acetyltransferase involved in cellulose biosynthesis
VQISVARPGELGPSEIAAWRSMQRSTPSFANPFLSPDFAITVAKFRPGTRVAVLSDGQSTVGFFAFEQRRFGLGMPLAPGMTDCQGLVHAPGAQWDVRELLQACRLSVWKFDHLVEGQRPFEPYRIASNPSPVIDLTHGFASYHDQLRMRSPQLYKNVQRKARKFGREAGELRFVPDSEDESAFRNLLAWKSIQYRRTAQADVFARPWTSGLVEALFATRSSYFSGLLSVLYADDVPVAAHFGLRCEHTLAHWFPAYDAKFSKYSPGLILHLRMAELTPGVGVQIIDMGTGAQRYKEELKNRDIFVGEGIVTGRSLLAAVHQVRGIGGRWTTDTIKRHRSLFEPAAWLRKQYRLVKSARKRPSTPLDTKP